MDILIEVGRTPTPPKPPVSASSRTSSERPDAPYSRDRADAPDRRGPSEDHAAHGRETQGREAPGREAQRRDERDGRSRTDAPRHADQKRDAQEVAAGPSGKGADIGDADKTQDSFSSHLAARKDEANIPLAEAPPKIIDLAKPPAAPTDAIADKIVTKPAAAEMATAQPVYPAVETAKAALVANVAEAKPVEAVPVNIKATPPKTAPANIKTAATIPRITAATVAEKGAQPARISLTQDLQGFALPDNAAAPDVETELKPQIRERIDLRPAGAAAVKLAPPAFNRIAVAEMAPPVIPQGDLIIDAGLGADAGPDLAALKQIASGAASQVSAVGTASQTAQSQTPAASQIVAAVKAERVGNGNTIEIRLDPPEMGRVRIDLSLETADAVKAVLTVERSETLEHLRRNMNDLLDQLKQAGFATVDLEFSNRGSSGFGAGEEAAAFADMENDPSLQKSDVVYLSLRDNAQIDLLV